MKFILLILILSVTNASGQIDTIRLDTLPVYVKVNRCTTWNYYHSNGVLLWRDAEYNTSLVPPNGYMEQSVNMKPNYSIVKGYCVRRLFKDGSMKEIIAWLDASKVEIKNRWIEPFLNLR